MFLTTHGLDAPPFSGGVLDAWPAWGVDALRVAKQEWPLVGAYAARVRAGRG